MRNSAFALTLTAALGLLSPPLSAQTPGEDEAALRVVALEAEPARVQVLLGESFSLRITARDVDGRVVEAPLRVVGPRNALQVQGGGERITALGQGDHEVVVTVVLPPDAGGAPPSLRIPVRVGWPPVATVSIDRGADRLYEGGLLSHRGRAWHPDGTERSHARVQWRSSDATVATVDGFGNVRARRSGLVTITAAYEGVEESVEYRVEPFPGTTLELTGGVEEARTGDVLTYIATVRDAGGAVVEGVPVTWALAYQPDDSIVAPSAPGQVRNGRVVADVPGIYTVVATAGPVSAASSFQAVPRNVVQPLEMVGQGRQDHVRTTDLWVFEGVDGRDYAVTGAKMSDGHGYVFDVTDPSNIVKIDSIQVDARSVNDMKVSPDARYATLTREGASNRRNGLVLLDLSNPRSPVVASEVVEGLTGGVHNAFPTEDYVYALSNGEKYLIIDVRDIYNPRVVGEVQHGDCRIHDVWVYEGIAYSAQWGCGMIAYDVGNGRWGGSVENPVFISALPVPSQATHAVFPYRSQSTGRFYVFIGDEIMTRRGLAWEGPQNPGSYQDRYDPETGTGGFPLATQGYVQVIDFTDPENPEMVARYEMPEYGSHNIWVEDDILYQAYYEGGLRMVDVSGELMGNLYTQGREIAVFKPFDPAGYVANAPMVWSAMPHKGHIFISDTNSGLWSVKVQPEGRPVM